MIANARGHVRQVKKIAQRRRERGKIVKPVFAQDAGAGTG